MGVGRKIGWGGKMGRGEEEDEEGEEFAGRKLKKDALRRLCFSTGPARPVSCALLIGVSRLPRVRQT